MRGNTFIVWAVARSEDKSRGLIRKSILDAKTSPRRDMLKKPLSDGADLDARKFPC
jgi:hypothetical protein